MTSVFLMKKNDDDENIEIRPYDPSTPLEKTPLYKGVSAIKLIFMVTIMIAVILWIICEIRGNFREAVIPTPSEESNTFGSQFWIYLGIIIFISVGLPYLITKLLKGKYPRKEEYISDIVWFIVCVIFVGIAITIIISTPIKYTSSDWNEITFVYENVYGEIIWEIREKHLYTILNVVTFFYINTVVYSVFSLKNHKKAYNAFLNDSSVTYREFKVEALNTYECYEYDPEKDLDICTMTHIDASKTLIDD